MPLQGKLSIGLLLEDNPYKSYFVYKPLFTREDGSYKQFVDAEKAYPEDGSIRIVPDKNEMNTFKIRMRKIGSLCAMDLRRFPGENNKIRPNKNYSRELGEKNQFIVYSDVLTSLSTEEFTEVLNWPEESGEAEIHVATTPLLEAVALRRGETISGPFWATILEEGGAKLVPGDETWEFSEEEMREKDRLIDITLADGSQRLILGGLAKDEAMSGPVYEEIEDTQPKRPLEAEKEGAKPWISRNDSIAPTNVRGYINNRDQFMAAQSGLNPRRGRSLSEVIDDQWRKSRVDQLGHPIPAQAPGRPGASPIELAMDAFSEAWRIHDARSNMLNQLLGIPELREALKDYFTGDGAGGEAAAFEEALNEFEANRLKLAMEIDELRAEREELFDKLLIEVRRRNTREMAELDREKEATEARLSQLAEEVESLEARARAAENTLNALFGEKFEERISAKIMEDRVVLRLLEKKDVQDVPPTALALEEIERDALVERVTAHLRQAGFVMLREEIVNLLILTALDDVILLSGQPGSGHTALSESFAQAIGADFARVASAEALQKNAAGVVEFEDINRVNAGAVDAQAMSLARREKGEKIVFATASDAPDGEPVAQKLLCAAYFVRVKPPSVNVPWRNYSISGDTGERISLEAVRNAMKPTESIPTQLEMKLFDIRTALLGAGYQMGRDMLMGLWRYCTMGIEHLGISPMEVLDFALAQRALPAIMASMEPRVLRVLPSVFADMPRCKAMMGERLPVF